MRQDESKPSPTTSAPVDLAASYRQGEMLGRQLATKWSPVIAGVVAVIVGILVGWVVF
jgi:hypothetical protein